MAQQRSSIGAIGDAYYAPDCSPARKVSFSWRYENDDSATWIEFEIEARITECVEINSVCAKLLGATIAGVSVTAHCATHNLNNAGDWFEKQYAECDWFRQQVIEAAQDALEMERL